MKEFALKHPYLTALLLVPALTSGVVRLAYEVFGTKTPWDEFKDNVSKKKLEHPDAKTVVEATSAAWGSP